MTQEERIQNIEARLDSLESNLQSILTAIQFVTALRSEGTSEQRREKKETN